MFYTILRKENDNMNELEAYDSIGMQYYYLRNIDKAMYYHNRMMNGILESNTEEKQDNIESLSRVLLTVWACQNTE